MYVETMLKKHAILDIPMAIFMQKLEKDIA